METISLNDFMKLDLRVGKVLEASKVEGSKKLLKLKVDIGGEIRQLVAGIAEYYAPRDLEGKLVVVVANLQPKKIRGVISQGMLLAADHMGEPVLIVPEKNVPPGTKVR